MRVLIVGSGNAGRNLAEKLCDEKHDVVLVDNRQEPLTEVQSYLDIMTVRGSGASPAILEKAEIRKADLLVAVTDRDEVNLLACVMAHLAGVPHKVARVSNLDYLRPPEGYDLHKLGIDLVVSQKDECACELFNVLRMPGTLEAVDLLEDRVLSAGIRVHMDSPLIREPLKAFPKPELLQTIRFIAGKRGDELLVPRGDSQFMVGDEIYFVGPPDDVNAFLEWAWPEHSSFQKVVIAGGGDVGVRLAQLLEKTPMQVVLIEPDEERTEYCSGILGRTLVIRGDPMNDETQTEAGLGQNTAFVAATPDDESNIIGCLLAAKLGARFTLAQVNKPEYVPIIDSLSLLDHVVSPPLSMINAILHFVRGKHVKAAALFHKLPGELLEVVLSPRGKWVGKAVKDLSLPAGVTLAAGLRDDKVLSITGDLLLAAGDRLVLFSPPEAVNKLASLFRK
ncbi:MAG: Trk system potassium transporter TrkA [Kiritimatiellae bacterium]|nr:Trk system potassium transporter TrkA [Kiritimatiellia bacterium]